MTIMEMLGQSGVLTLLGMAVVFGFLIVMVFIISQIGRFFASRGGEPVFVKAAAGSSAPAGADKAQITAVISAAVAEYQKSQ